MENTLKEFQQEFSQAATRGQKWGELRTYRLKQDGNDRLFVPFKETSSVEPLKTIMKALCVRADNVAIYDVENTYTQSIEGIKQESKITLIPDPAKSGLNVTEIVKFIQKIVKDYPTSEYCSD
jgi:hypothetical protein